MKWMHFVSLFFCFTVLALCITPDRVFAFSAHDSFNTSTLNNSLWQTTGNGISSSSGLFSGYLAINGNNNWNQNTVYSAQQFSRSGGKAFVVIQRNDVAIPLGAYHFTSSTSPLNPDESGYGLAINNTDYGFRSIVGNQNLRYPIINGVGNFYSHDYMLITVLRPDSGSYHLVSGGGFGTFPESTLLWVNQNGDDTNLYAGVNLNSGNTRLDYMQVNDFSGNYATQYGLASGADTFSRSDSGTIGSTEVGAKTWVEDVVDSWSIVNGKLTIDGSGGSRAIVSQIGSEGIFEADVTPSTSIGNIGVIARYSDGNNYLVMAFEDSILKLYKKVAGSFSIVSQIGYSYSVGTTYRLRLMIHGNTLCMYVNNDLPYGSCVVDSFNSSATGAGVYAFDAGSTIDNVAFWPKNISLPTDKISDFPTIPRSDSTVLASDSFSASDGASLSSHTMNNGTGWALNRGSWTISGNAVSAGAIDSIATTNTGQTDIAVSADITLPTAISGTTEWFSGLIARFSDTDNFIRARFLWQNGSPEIEIWQVKNGSSTFPSAVNLSNKIIQGGTYAMKLVVVGRQVAVYFDNILVAQATTTLDSGSRAGMFVDSDSAITSPYAVFDNFLVQTTQADAVPPPEITDLALSANSGNNPPVMTWTNVIDDASGTSGYNIYRSINQGVLGSLVGNVSASSFTDSTINTNGTYVYTIRAVDAENNEQDSAYNSQVSYIYGDGSSSNGSQQPYTTTTTTSSSSTSQSCGDSRPTETPDLFQIDVYAQRASLYFAPSQEPVKKYFVSYGFWKDDERFGSFHMFPTENGVRKADINHLAPRHTYFFKVRAINGCSYGEYGNTMRIVTTNSTARGRYFKLFPYRFIF